MAPAPCKACLGHVYFQLPPDIVRSLQNGCSLKFRFLFKYVCFRPFMLVTKKNIPLAIFKQSYLVGWGFDGTLNFSEFCSNFYNSYIGKPGNLNTYHPFSSDFKFAQVHPKKWTDKISKRCFTGWLIPSHLPASSFVTHLLNSPISADCPLDYAAMLIPISLESHCVLRILPLASQGHKVMAIINFRHATGSKIVLSHFMASLFLGY